MASAEAVLVGGGIFVWWPRHSGAVKGAFKLDRRLTGRARSLSIHKTLGVYVSLVLLALVLTALPLSFDWYRKGLYVITGSPLPKAPARRPPPADARPLSMQTLWQRARSLAPEPADMLLHYASKDNATIDGYSIAREAPHENARTVFQLDAYTGQVLHHTSYVDSSLGHKLYFWTLSFHTGRVGGIPGQMLLLSGALSVPVLAFTGISSCLRRRFPGTGLSGRKLGNP